MGWIIGLLARYDVLQQLAALDNSPPDCHCHNITMTRPGCRHKSGILRGGHVSGNETGRDADHDMAQAGATQSSTFKKKSPKKYVIIDIMLYYYLTGWNRCPG